MSSKKGHYGWKKTTYQSWSQLPLKSGTYDNAIWVEKNLSTLKHRRENNVGADTGSKLLPDSVNKINKSFVRIVDYGGGLGLSYFPLIKKTNKQIDYHIVEPPNMATAGQENVPEISFTSDVPKNLKNVDIFYIGTALQYSQDWHSLLQDIISLQPSSVVLAQVTVSDAPSYLVLQCWADQEIPYWVLNREELKTIVSEGGYECVCDEYVDDLNFKTPNGKKVHNDLDRTHWNPILVDLVFDRKK